MKYTIMNREYTEKYDKMTLLVFSYDSVPLSFLLSLILTAKHTESEKNPAADPEDLVRYIHEVALNT